MNLLRVFTSRYKKLINQVNHIQFSKGNKISKKVEINNGGN